MKVLVIGKGGREHAIIRALKKSNKVKEIYCAPGNGGISCDAINVPINEFIIGSIELKKQYNDSYIIDILENYKGIEIEFKSNYSEL